MQRPAGVTILAVLGIIAGALLALLGLLLMVGGPVFFGIARSRLAMMGGMSGAIVGVVLMGIAALYIVTSVGLLKLQGWARILAIVLTGIGLLVSGLGLLDALANLHMLFFFGALVRHVVALAIDVWILIYLFQPHVKQAFSGKPGS